MLRHAPTEQVNTEQIQKVACRSVSCAQTKFLSQRFRNCIVLHHMLWTGEEFVDQNLLTINKLCLANCKALCENQQLLRHLHTECVNPIKYFGRQRWISKDMVLAMAQLHFCCLDATVKVGPCIV